MPKIRTAQTNFTAGELSPLVAARSDVRLYANGAEKLRNMAPRSAGGVTTRPALIYLATIPQTPALLAPFVFNDAQRYAFVFSNNRVDIYNPDGSLAIALTGAPWTSAMLDRLAWASNGDTTIVCHPDLPMQKIQRTGAATFTRAALTFETGTGNIVYQPYYKFADTPITLTPSATTGAITLTASAAVFSASHVGTIVRYQKKQISVTGFTSATVVSGTVLETLPGTSASTDWDEQMFSAVRGYAHSAAFSDNRLQFGGAKSRPGAYCTSKIGAFFNFDVGTALDNEAINDSVTGSEIVEVRHISAERHVLLFTDQGPFLIPTSDSRPLTPKNVAFRRQAPYGTNYMRPALFDGAVLFGQKTGTIMREAQWVDTEQAYTADAVSLLAEHLIASPTQLAVLHGSPTRQEQYAVAANGDGKLSVFHSVRSEKIAAWAPWDTQGSFKSVATIGQELFVLVARTLNGSAVWTLEKFDDTAAPLDCAKKVTSGGPATTFNGFTHLANMAVKVVSKGHYLGTFTVSGGGTITLDTLAPAVTEIEAGLPYEQRIRPMPVDFDLPNGPARGLMKRLVRAIVMVDRAGAFQVAGEDVLLSFQGDDFATDAVTATGQIEFRLLGIDRNAQFDLVIADPFRVTVLGLMREVQLNG